MSTYIRIYCPYCNSKMNGFHERQESYFYSKYIGLPYSRCPHCNKIYRTGKKLYSEMSEMEQNKIKRLFPKNIFSSIFTVSACVIISGTLIGSLISSISGNQITFIFLIASLLISFPFICIWAYKSSKKELELVKNMKIEDFEVEDKELLELLKQ